MMSNSSGPTQSARAGGARPAGRPAVPPGLHPALGVSLLKAALVRVAFPATSCTSTSASPSALARSSIPKSRQRVAFRPWRASGSLRATCLEARPDPRGFVEEVLLGRYGDVYGRRSPIASGAARGGATVPRRRDGEVAWDQYALVGVSSTFQQNCAALAAVAACENAPSGDPHSHGRRQLRRSHGRRHPPALPLRRLRLFRGGRRHLSSSRKADPDRQPVGPCLASSCVASRTRLMRRREPPLVLDMDRCRIRTTATISLSSEPAASLPSSPRRWHSKRRAAVGGARSTTARSAD